MTPGVSILPRVSTLGQGSLGSLYPRLALEVFHDVEESVIHIWLLMKLDLDLVEVAQCILTKNKVSVNSHRKCRALSAREHLR